MTSLLVESDCDNRSAYHDDVGQNYKNTEHKHGSVHLFTIVFFSV